MSTLAALFVIMSPQLLIFSSKGFTYIRGFSHQFKNVKVSIFFHSLEIILRSNYIFRHYLVELYTARIYIQIIQYINIKLIIYFYHFYAAGWA